MATPEQFRNKWRIRWTNEFGKRCSAIFKNYSEAEFILRKKQIEVEEIRLGLRKPRPPEKTFDELCDYWLKYRTSRKRNPKDDPSIMRCHLRPFFGRFLLQNINIELIDLFISGKNNLNPKTISNILTLLISLLNLAKSLGWATEIPKIKKPKIRLNSKDFNYLRTNEEVNRFLSSAKSEGDMPYMLYLTAIHTGMRAGELAGLKWGDIDIKRRLITVQRSYEGPTKSDDVRYIPILDSLLPMLKQWKESRFNEIVFPNQRGRIHGKAARVFQEIFHRILDRAEFPKILKNGKERRYIVFHDLRHTFASHWMMSGGELFKLQKILGHKSSDMTLRYSHLDPRTFEKDYSLINFFSSNPKSNLITN